ncbi:hypothetical protein A3J20_03265 [Candidatus Gottesmanbacteria bacterium RIFCSPLOWO2_02_FULL_42_29]|uniref:Uncharacterized protein n=2 Tax=Candidatus Gottesmaniibacteriota TaxID=1752720 RepID=A0A1F6BDK9_9BACT|nr:MAG: hypothetical protein UV09_C0002G0020 [Candidatus Gottesmanbacteria bacterium GW2011_GWA2_42_18]OGG12199.1 MAG: hypothetical protein A2781_04750 [Candidatus Gottesmanbacteria bacterium RIFCSPHIGHO2_01_FULL_42_27]OGG21687.1 MAG: hypothetical protein A3E72_04415 [Candidatus Gottesmanbacteria bacterium RIFCSPHIGHO2_12_FULL_43_26]OGG34226.1 MAG: hypothetical protein A3G68_02880 [Candidatus Gottesmanbacteria bacterium RIFCSPLOWO2_12_FULL_42_10]OGG35024.1 MAG: hypothetical protein A2968_00115 
MKPKEMASQSHQPAAPASPLEAFSQLRYKQVQYLQKYFPGLEPSHIVDLLNTFAPTAEQKDRAEQAEELHQAKAKRHDLSAGLGNLLVDAERRLQTTIAESQKPHPPSGVRKFVDQLLQPLTALSQEAQKKREGLTGILFKDTTEDTQPIKVGESAQQADVPPFLQKHAVRAALSFDIDEKPESGKQRNIWDRSEW